MAVEDLSELVNKILIHNCQSYRSRFIRGVVILKNKDGKFLGIVMQTIDITERKKAEEELKHNTTILSEVNDAIITTKNDKNFTITSWNPGAERKSEKDFRCV